MISTSQLFLYVYIYPCAGECKRNNWKQLIQLPVLINGRHSHLGIGKIIKFELSNAGYL